MTTRVPPADLVGPGSPRHGHIVLILPDGIGVRNFVLGRFLREARRTNRVTLLHGMPKHLLRPLVTTAGVQLEALVPCADAAATFLLRNTLSYAQMHWANTHGMRFQRRRPVAGSLRARAAVHASRLGGRLAASRAGIRVLDRWHTRAAARRPEVGRYRQLFRRLAPTVVFCSHQRPASVLAPVLAAKSLGIPTATFIFSWDNLTSKGRIAAPFDHYLVWSDRMRDELLTYYPDVSPARVHLAGTPQFDPYADESLLWTRREFFDRIGGDPARPLVCYSGGDASIYPGEQEYVRLLVDLVRRGAIAGRPQVLVRPAPVDDGSRYAGVRWGHPELLFEQPAWLRPSGDWSAAVPTADDVQFLVNLTRHAAVNVNIASTMTLDFAINDTPVVNVAFDAVNPPPLGVPLWDCYYQFEHYRPVIELGAARIARSADALAQHVSDCLTRPELDREGRKRFVDLEVGVPVGESARRVLDVLETIAAAPERRPAFEPARAS
jgi:hypothetical protein